MRRLLINSLSILFLFGITLLVFPPKASAHCDTLDGPVINAAKKAMAKDNANYILIWVKSEHEDEIRKALKKALARRKKAKSKQEKDNAEMELFETLVKIHREGEGAKYEGIKPAGSVEAEIALADRAVESGNLHDVLKHILNPKNKEIIQHLFLKLQEKSHYNEDDVISGREFINTYVIFIHAVEKAIKGEMLQEDDLHEH